MDKFGGVVILSESCFSPARCFPEGHKRLCSYTQESCKMCVFCERGALELVILFHREKSTSASGHTQPDHWFPSFADASPQPSTPGLPSRSPPPPHPQTLILPMSPKAYSHSHCGFDPSQQHQLTSLSFLKHFLLLASVHHIFYLSLRLFFSVFFDSFPSQLSDLLKTEGPRVHRDFHST